MLPLKPGFHQENFLGMNASDYGGATPVVDVWNRQFGVAVGHLDIHPRQVPLPVSAPDVQHAMVAVVSRQAAVVQPHQTLYTLRTFVSVHRGDYYAALVTYRRMMETHGLSMNPAPLDAFGPIWCAWGYGRNFGSKQIDDTLPTAKKLGFKWVTVDVGGQNNVGDWLLDPHEFPRGDADMKALVDKIHRAGLKAQLWWSPLSAVPDSLLLKQHPEWALINQDGSRRPVSWWDSFYLCPADSAVLAYHKAIVDRILGVWGLDGLTLDGQHMNAVPLCYNSTHHHASPEDSAQALPHFFRELYQKARRVKPDALVEFCPCGTGYSFFTLPGFNMAVASDPPSSWQVRSKGKTLKAVIGDSVAYFGDHTELSDGGDDFASTIGVGGIVGSEFTLQAEVAKDSPYVLTPAREAAFSKWPRIYRDEKPSTGQYLGTLYDIGFDKPETHAIREGRTMYYALFSDSWRGNVQLRGLTQQKYRVVNYEKGTVPGSVNGPLASLAVSFSRHLLLKAISQ